MNRNERVALLILASVFTLAAGSPEKRNPAPTMAAMASQKLVSQPQVANAGKSDLPIEPAEYYQPCGKSRNENSDLCAQWSAARAAQAAARWSWWQLWLSGFGVIGLGVTLWFNFRALSLAERESAETRAALDIAERNAKATAALVKVSQEMSHHELRAYLDFDGVKFLRDESRDTPSEIGTGISICVRNYGQTPASNVSMSITYYFDNGSSKIMKLMSEAEKKITFLMPLDHGTSNAHFKLPREVWTALKQRQSNMKVAIRLNYTDFLGNDHYVNCDFVSHGVTRELGFVPNTREAN